MDKQISISSEDKIFATGVFLQPVKCTINETEQWRWVAIGFEEDSFLNGEAINPIEYADDIDGLIANFEEEN